MVDDPRHHNPIGNRPIVLATTVGLLLLGVAIQSYMWSHQWIYGDQYALLTPAVQYLDGAELAPFSKQMSGDGRIPGTLLQRLVAAPLWLWADLRAPALLMGLSQLAAVGILLAALGAAYGGRFAACFVAVYWLSPWRLYHSGVLWEPGFLLFPAAAHLGCCWLLRATDGDDGRGSSRATPGEATTGAIIPIAASFGLGALLVASLQIHASFVVLGLATAMLAWRRLLRVRPAGLAAGMATAGITLLPTIAAAFNGTLPRLSPRSEYDVSWPLHVVSNAGKAAIYWFRMGSADIGRRLRQTAWLSETPAGTEAAVPLPVWFVAAVSVLTVATVVIALWANGYFFRRAAAAPATAASDTAAPDRGWLRSYVGAIFVAMVISAAASPIPIQGWHLVIILHAACIPTAAWLAYALAEGGRLRTLGVALVVLLATTSILIALGHPTYLRPDGFHEQQQSIPEYLRHLIPPR